MISGLDSAIDLPKWRMPNLPYLINNDSTNFTRRTRIKSWPNYNLRKRLLREASLTRS